MAPESPFPALRAPERRNPEDDRALHEDIKQAKVDAVRAGDEAGAKRLWCLETVLSVQRDYRAAFDAMRSGAFYRGWCSLAAVERHLVHLARHHALDDYRLDFIRAQTSRFQAVYRLFLSPAYVVRDRRCGICGSVLTPRRGCAHRKGEIYGGEMCGHRLRIRITSMSLVTQPVGKERVAFPTDPASGRPKDYGYPVVEYVAARLASPYHAWDFRWTRRSCSHRAFGGVGGDEPCPCGSGNAYSRCCLPRPRLSIPHCDVRFAVPPPRRLLDVQHFYGGSRT